MINSLKRFLASATIVLASTVAAYAVPVCNGGAVCEDPDFNGTTILGWTLNAGSILTIKTLNSMGPNGNQTNSNYWFAATTNSGLGASSANGSIVPSGTGTTQVGSTPTHPSSTTPGSTVVNGAISGTKGGTTYFIYAQACPTATSANGTNCSNWIRINASSVNTAAYPTSVFFAPTKPTDATTNSISVRTNITPSADQANVSQIDITVQDLRTPANDQTISPLGYLGDSTPYVIDNTEYTNGFIPNNKYDYQGQVQYPWDLVPTGGAQTIGPFWTTPVQPGFVTAFNVTHCSVQMDAENAGGSPANPNYTIYNLCATGTGGSCTNQLIGGGASTSLTSTGTINGLDPNTTYGTRAIALVGDGSDSTSNGWNDSVAKTGSSFTTLDWSPSASVTGITTTTGDYNVTIGNTSGLTQYQVFLNGVAQSGSPLSAPVPATIHFTGLTPNTAYTATIVLYEASCNSSPLASTNFTTTADIPTGFSLAVNSPTQLTASWGRAGNPSSGITYKVQYCTDAGFTANCLTPMTTALTLALSSLTPETTYYGHVLAQSVGGGVDSAYSSTDFKMTPNQAPALAAVTTTVWTTSATLTTSATDNGGPGHLVFVWAATAGGTLTSTAGTTTISGGTATSTTQVVFSGGGAANGTVFVYDHDRDGDSQQLSSNTTWTTSSSRVPTSLSIAPGTVTVGTGQLQNYNVTIKDQFGAVIVGSTATWATIGAAGTLSPNLSTFTVLTAGSTPGSFGIRATNGVATATATVTVSATAPHFLTGPSAVVYLTTATFSATATSINGPNSIVYAWSIQAAPAGAPTVEINTNSANSATISTATFHQAGLYTVRCTITDTTPGFGGSTFADFPVTVTQVLNSALTVTPGSARVQTDTPQKFTAMGTDQFGKNFALGSVAWSVVGGGAITPTTGVFSDTDIGDNVTVHAVSGSASGSATVVVFSFNVSGAFAYPVPFKASRGDTGVTFKGLGSSATIDIYTPSARKVFSIGTSADMYVWPVKNSSGENVASGVYFYHIESPGGKKDGKLIIIK